MAIDYGKINTCQPDPNSISTYFGVFQNGSILDVKTDCLTSDCNNCTITSYDGDIGKCTTILGIPQEIILFNIPTATTYQTASIVVGILACIVASAIVAKLIRLWFKKDKPIGGPTMGTCDTLTSICCCTPTLAHPTDCSWFSTFGRRVQNFFTTIIEICQGKIITILQVITFIITSFLAVFWRESPPYSGISGAPTDPVEKVIDVRPLFNISDHLASFGIIMVTTIWIVMLGNSVADVTRYRRIREILTHLHMFFYLLCLFAVYADIGLPWFFVIIANKILMPSNENILSIFEVDKSLVDNVANFIPTGIAALIVAQSATLFVPILNGIAIGFLNGSLVATAFSQKEMERDTAKIIRGITVILVAMTAVASLWPILLLYQNITNFTWFILWNILWIHPLIGTGISKILHESTLSPKAKKKGTLITATLSIILQIVLLRLLKNYENMDFNLKITLNMFTIFAVCTFTVIFLRKVVLGIEDDGGNEDDGKSKNQKIELDNIGAFPDFEEQELTSSLVLTTNSTFSTSTTTLSSSAVTLTTSTSPTSSKPKSSGVPSTPAKKSATSTKTPKSTKNLDKKNINNPLLTNSDSDDDLTLLQKIELEKERETERLLMRPIRRRKMTCAIFLQLYLKIFMKVIGVIALVIILVYSSRNLRTPTRQRLANAISLAFNISFEWPNEPTMFDNLFDVFRAAEENSNEMQLFGCICIAVDMVADLILSVVSTSLYFLVFPDFYFRHF